MADADYAFALSLQEEFSLLDDGVKTSGSAKRKLPESIVDDSWETIDPTPDIRELFLQFNDTYFNGALLCCEVKWAPRMTLCAGVCCYEGHGGLCSIKLSLPLLKLRPRKDLVETLLHEMIHAYLFVTHNNKDHDSHGPEFHKHMNRINRQSGANITVYHNFHNEVDLYRQHWWRCDGPCQQRPPYFGMVKRAMNRPPAPRDPWWADHQRTCGGTYHKVQEPNDYGKKKRKKDDTGDDLSTKGMRKIYDFWNNGLSRETIGDDFSESVIDKSNHDKKLNSISKNFWPEEKTEKSEKFEKENFSVIPFCGQGHVLGSLNKNISNDSFEKKMTSRSVPEREFVDFVQSNPGSSSARFRNNKIGSTSRNEKIPASPSGRLRENAAWSHLKPGHLDFDGKHQNIVDICNPGANLEKTRSVRDASILNKKKGSDNQLTIIDAFKKVGDKKMPLIVVDDKPLRSDASLAVKLVSCPVCQIKVNESKINVHLDACL